MTISYKMKEVCNNLLKQIPNDSRIDKDGNTVYTFPAPIPKSIQLQGMKDLKDYYILGGTLCIYKHALQQFENCVSEDFDELYTTKLHARTRRVVDSLVPNTIVRITQTSTKSCLCIDFNTPVTLNQLAGVLDLLDKRTDYIISAQSATLVITTRGLERFSKLIDSLYKSRFESYRLGPNFDKKRDQSFAHSNFSTSGSFESQSSFGNKTSFFGASDVVDGKKRFSVDRVPSNSSTFYTVRNQRSFSGASDALESLNFNSLSSINSPT